jgi:hypothetical protein
MANQYLARLRGTLQNIFRIGNSSGVSLKNNSGTLQVRNGGDTAHAAAEASSIKLLGSNTSNGVTLTVPNSLGANVTLTLPSDDGASGDVLYTDGSGSLYWAAPGSDAITIAYQEFNQATSSPLTIFTPSANAKILRVRVIVTAAASGGTPTLSIGYSGSTSAYMTTSENDLKTAGEYQIDEVVDVGGSPSAVIATITPSGQTFTGAILIEWAA